MTAPVITTAPVGPATLSALAAAIARAKADDPFARVVVIADHNDAARAVLHWLGAQGTGMINVTVQTGRRLAAELAGDGQKTLPRTLESHAVRLVAALDDAAQEFGPAGRNRYYRSLAAAFREMAERPDAPAPPDAPDAPDESPAGDAMNARAETLHAAYRRLVQDKGYGIPADLPQRAADAVANRTARRLPYVIYYLPRRLSAGDLALAQALQAKGRCAVIAGRSGDSDADAPALRLRAQLGGSDFDESDFDECDFGETAGTGAGGDPLQQRAGAGRLSLIAAPDPEEEVRTVIRRIAAGDAPFHRAAIIYRQANPYDSLLRQELDFAGIPYAGAEYRTLGDTPTGRLLQGIVDLAAHAGAADGAIDRERLIEWMTTTPVRWPGQQTPDGKGRPVPATGWANLAREARANGAPEAWQSRLNMHWAKVAARMKELRDDYDDGGRLRQNCADLHSFIADLSARLHMLGSPQPDWATAATQLNERICAAYRWYGDGETDSDRQRVAELIDSLSELGNWEVAYDLDTLQEAIREGLQAAGFPGGAAPWAPASILARRPALPAPSNDAVYAVGMVEAAVSAAPRRQPLAGRQPGGTPAGSRPGTLRFPRRGGRRRPGRAVLAGSHRRAAPGLSLPLAGGGRQPAAPAGRRQRPAGLRRHCRRRRQRTLAHADSVAAGRAGAAARLRDGAGRCGRLPADAPGGNAGKAARAFRRPDAPRSGSPRRPQRQRLYGMGRRSFPADTARIAGIGSRERPVSPSALETWAACPYRYFLSRILGLAALPEDDDAGEMSALDRGALVHKILERSVTEGKQTPAELLALAEQEFEDAAARGIAGHYLLWEMEKAKIREGLTAFLDREKVWLGNAAPDESRAEVAFDGVKVSVEGLGEVWCRGAIDRLDLLGDAVRVRDFKTGKPDNYTSGLNTQNAVTVANGRALQLPVYTAAARRDYPNATVTASYCFPLADKNTHGARPYNDAQDSDEFQVTLQRIVGSARAGVFPATPDGAGAYSNCHRCDFNRLCPARRRQIWERKGRDDAAVRPYNALGGKAAIKD